MPSEKVHRSFSGILRYGKGTAYLYRLHIWLQHPLMWLKPLTPSESPAEFLQLWRAQRAYRAGRILCVLAIVVAVLSIVADSLWSPVVVVYADIIFLGGALLSLWQTFRDKNQAYFYWVPCYIGFWVSMWPSLWATGGANSPLLGIFLALLCIFGIILQTRIALPVIVAFVVLHIPVIFSLDYFIAFSSQPLPPPILVASMHILTVFGFGTSLYALLRTEYELSGQFSERFNELLSTKADLRREEESNLAKTTFLANVSHELRTPLGAILGYTELLTQNEADKADQQAYVEIIRRNSEQLGRLVDDLLDLSKTEVGTLEVVRQALNLNELLTDVYSLCGLAAHKKGLRLDISFKNAVPAILISDLTRLRQILLNVVGNAIKFTEKGAVDIYLETFSELNKLTITVTDTGRGILPDQEAKLFKPFSQGDPSLARRYGGTGLGLSLSRNLAILLKGSLELLPRESGKGSSFVLTLPLGTVPNQSWLDHFEPSALQAHDEVRVAKDRLKGRRILFVDDTIDNQQLVRSYLESVGASVELASDGYEGIEKALKGNFDVVLMDIQMPHMDGYEAVKILRTKGYKVPILAFTAHAMKEDLQRCLAAGCNGHLSKPASQTLLVKSIEQVIQPEPSVYL